MSRKEVITKDNKTGKKKVRTLVSFFVTFIGATILAIALRIFFFASFTIPSDSMEPALVAGDQIIVNKQIPGPRIIENFLSLSKGEKPVLKRIKGYRNVKRNDILVFNYPYTDWNHLALDLNTYYTKRCVALPGDTFYIDNGIYKVMQSKDSLGSYHTQRNFSKINPEEIDPVIYNCFPFDDRYGWNCREFGPLYVPAKNDRIKLDTLNIRLYEKLIRYETGEEVSVKENQVMLGDSIITDYTFRKNYYFMAGDLVSDSKDSRYWGLLPEDHIIGKVIMIWKSNDPYTGKLRKDRILRTVK
ncbi:MAG: signal peptidase I [Candidatus Azobacteroides sp.]|nr:signal peptidase I [Candidatus Azobacteroides sp.]